MMKWNSILCPVHSANGSRVLHNDLSNFLIRVAGLFRIGANSQYLLLDWLTFLCARMFLELRFSCRFQFFRNLFLFRSFQLIGCSLCFNFCVLCCIVLDIFSYTASYFCLCFSVQRKVCRVGVEINHSSVHVQLHSRLHLTFANATFGTRLGLRLFAWDRT